MKSVGMNPSEQVGLAIEDKIRLLLHFNLTRSWWTWPTRWRRKEWYISRSCLAQLAVLSSSFSSSPPIPTSPSPPPPPSPHLLLPISPHLFFLPYKISISSFLPSLSIIPFVLLFTDIYESTVCMIPNVRLAKKSGGQGFWLHLGGSWSSFLFKILRTKGFILSLWEKYTINSSSEGVSEY